MALVPAKCTECGASIEVDASKEAGICSHCGTAFITEKVINNFTTNYNTVHNVTNNVTKIINGKNSDEGEDYFNRGLTNLKLKKYDAARKNFDKAINKNPEIAKYYFYWGYAASDAFKDVEVFFPEIAPTFWRTEEDEEDNSIESFFTLATDEEKQQLSQEYGVDLTSGFSAFKIALLNRVFDNNTFYKGIARKFNYKKVFENLTAEEREQIKDSANNFFENNRKSSEAASTREQLNFLRILVDNDIHYESEKLKNFVGNERLLIEYLNNQDPEAVIEKDAAQQALAKKKQEDAALEEKRMNFTKYAAGMFAFIAFMIGLCSTWNHYASEGNGLMSIIIGCGAAIVGAAVGGVLGFILSLVIFKKRRE